MPIDHSEPVTAESFAALGIRLPIRHDTDGAIVDADGREVCLVDVWRQRPDDQVADLATLIVRACNFFEGEA